MAVRDFLDEKGVCWKVWPVSPASFNSQTAVEDYLGDYGDGWLCFESGTERRRLAEYPRDWAKRPDFELVKLLKKAAVVPTRNTPTANKELDRSRGS